MRLCPVFDGEVRPGTRAFIGERLARTSGAGVAPSVPMISAPPSTSSSFRRRRSRPGFVTRSSGARLVFG